jgi:ELWxxDGT repeat protein
MHRHKWILTAIAGAAVLLAWPAAARERVFLLRDIIPGEGSSMPEPAGTVNGVFLFVATDQAHGRELWRSDGTAAGTDLLRDIRPGAQSGIDLGGWAIAGGQLAFAASDGTGGAQLWRSDGTAAGTVRVRDTHPGDPSARARLVTPDGDRVWFTVQTHFFDPVRPGVEDLWVSDLTAAGTRRIASVGSWDPGFSGDVAAVTSLTPFRGGVLVARKDQIECCESVSLRQVDLASPEDAVVYDAYLLQHLRYLPPVRPTVAGETAYLDVDEVYGLDDCAMFRIDDETVPLATGPSACSLTPLAVFGNDLLLAQPPLRLQRATSGADALILVAELGEGRLSTHGVAATPNGVYFAASRADADELWRADNAVDPPVLVRRFPRTGSSEIQFLSPASSGVFFEVTGDFGRDARIWRSDGPSTQTRPLAALPYDTLARWVAEYGDGAILEASDPEHGDELWVIPQAATCTGDCNVSGTVAIDEVIRAVGIALGTSPPEDCAAADANADQQVSVDELVAALAGALDGCRADGPPR